MRSLDLISFLCYAVFIKFWGCKMVNYQKMYTILFSAITDAVALLDQFQPGDARTRLIRAQQAAKEVYLSDDSDEPS